MPFARNSHLPEGLRRQRYICGVAAPERCAEALLASLRLAAAPLAA